VTFKALWGGLDARNHPGVGKQLLFPVNDAGETFTHFLDHRPYIEASVGVSNILKILRIDLVRRFSYLENPGVVKMGVRAKIQLEF
ncbi:MAG: hypothetical protein ABIQ93_13495, partial [Saprospiraceae bacterium]